MRLICYPHQLGGAVKHFLLTILYGAVGFGFGVDVGICRLKLCFEPSDFVFLALRQCDPPSPVETTQAH